MAKGGKNKGPTAKQKPSLKKEPRVSKDTSPESALKKKPVWLLGILDFDGPWGWKQIKTIFLLEDIHEKLSNFETMLWGAIEGPQHHYIYVSSISKKAKKRLSTIRLEDCDQLFSLRLTGKKRVYGIRENEIFKILWWDPKHEICPAPKKYT